MSRWDWPMMFCGAVILLALGLIPVAIYASIQDSERWSAYSAMHHCRIVGKQDGDVGVGNTVAANGSVGVAVVATDSKTAYQCDDGVTYWRND